MISDLYLSVSAFTRSLPRLLPTALSLFYQIISCLNNLLSFITEKFMRLLAVGTAQEALYSIKTKQLKSAILKIDLSKAFNQVSWLYLRMLLTHLGFPLPFINWIMCCITTVSFSVLINGSASNFFSC